MIRQRTKIGTLPDGNDVFAINKVTLLPLCLDEPKDLELDVSKILRQRCNTGGGGVLQIKAV